MASRLPTREEWDENYGVGADVEKLLDSLPSGEGERQRRKLTRRSERTLVRRSTKQGCRPRQHLDVRGLLTESKYRELKLAVYDRCDRSAGSEHPVRRCEGCGRSDRRLTPHHRRLLSQGGRDEAANMLSLCWRCHDWAHEHPGTAAAKGWIVRAGDDPAATPVRLYDGSLVLLGSDGMYARQDAA